MNQTHQKQKLVLIRLDRIGDLVCTLPVDQVLDSNQFEWSWVINKGLGFIVDHAQVIPPQSSRSYIEINIKNKWQSFKNLFSYLNKNKFDHAILFHTPWWVGLCCLLAGVKKRSGPLSKWHSIFLNNWIRQSRSKSTKHEADYNLDLLTQSLSLKTQTNKTPHLTLRYPNDGEILKKLEIESKKYYLFHPGMSGSALNWSMKNYETLILNLIQKTNLKVVISGTDADDFYLKQIEHLKTHPQIVWAKARLSPSELIGVLQNAVAVVAPSTGVAHLASSTRVKTIGIYSPIPVQSKIRWGQRGADVVHVSPQVTCPSHFKCIQEKCIYFNCMDKIEIKDVESYLKESSK